MGVKEKILLAICHFKIKMAKEETVKVSIILNQYSFICFS